MADLTPQDRADIREHARRNPIVGDIWQKAKHNQREVMDVGRSMVYFRSSYLGRSYWYPQWEHFRWTRNATLVRRGA